MPRSLRRKVINRTVGPDIRIRSSSRTGRTRFAVYGIDGLGRRTKIYVSNLEDARQLRDVLMAVGPSETAVMDRRVLEIMLGRRTNIYG